MEKTLNTILVAIGLGVTALTAHDLNAVANGKPESAITIRASETDLSNRAILPTAVLFLSAAALHQIATMYGSRAQSQRVKEQVQHDLNSRGYPLPFEMREIGCLLDDHNRYGPFARSFHAALHRDLYH